MLPVSYSGKQKLMMMYLNIVGLKLPFLKGLEVMTIQLPHNGVRKLVFLAQVKIFVC